MQGLVFLVALFLIVVGSLTIGYIVATIVDWISEKTSVQRGQCLRCGGDMPDNARFCPHCGQRNNHA